MHLKALVISSCVTMSQLANVYIYKYAFILVCSHAFLVVLTYIYV